MKKTILTTAVATMSVLATVSNVNAEEVTPLVDGNNVSNIEESTISDIKISKEIATTNLGNAKASLENVIKEQQPTLDAEKKAKEVLDYKEKAIQDLDKVVSDSKKELEDLKSRAKEKEADVLNLTDTISSLKKEITNLEGKTEGLQNSVTEAKEKFESETEKIKPQVDALNATTTDLDTAKKEKEQADKDVIAAKMGGVQTAKDEVVKATNDLSNAQTIKEEKERALESAQREDAALDEQIIAKDSLVSEATKDKENKTSELVKAEEQYAELVRANADLSEKASRPSMVIDTAFLDLLKTKDTSNAQLRELGLKVLNEGPYRKILDDLAQSNTDVIDLNNLTEAQWKELNVFTAELIRDVRRAVGTDSDNLLKVTDETIKFGAVFSEIVEKTMQNHYGKEPTMRDVFNLGHALPAAQSDIDSLSYRAGLVDDANTKLEISYLSEVLGFSSMTVERSANMTMGQQKAAIYRYLATMMYNDSPSEWGHALILANLEGNQTDTYMTLELTTDDLYQRFGVKEIKLPVGFPNNARLIDSNAQTTAEISLTPVMLNNKPIEAIKAEYQETEKELADAKRAIDIKKSELINAANLLNTLTKELDTLKNTPKKTPSATSDLNKATVDVTNAETKLSESRQKLDRLSQRLTRLEGIAREKDEILADVQKRYDKAKEDYDLVSKDLEDAKADLLLAEALLASNKKGIESHKTKLATALDAFGVLTTGIKRLGIEIKVLEQELPNQEAKLEEAREELSEAKLELEQATEKANESRSLITAEQAKVEKWERVLADIKKEEELVAAIEDAKKQKVQKKEVLGEVELPKTGTSSDLSLLGGLLSMLGFVLVKKRK